jgi:hypothetical protein
VGGWNLSKYSGVQAEVVNNGDLPVQLALRVDNTGDWRQSPWNVESIRLQPRETRLLQVNFGKSSSNPGFVLDSAHISQILIFALKPGAPATVVVKNLSGFGVAGQAAPSVPVNAALAQR